MRLCKTEVLDILQLNGSFYETSWMTSSKYQPPDWSKNVKCHLSESQLDNNLLSSEMTFYEKNHMAWANQRVEIYHQCHQRVFIQLLTSLS